VAPHCWKTSGLLWWVCAASLSQIAQIFKGPSFWICDVNTNVSRIVWVREPFRHACHVLFRIPTPPVYYRAQQFSSLVEFWSAGFGMRVTPMGKSIRWKIRIIFFNHNRTALVPKKGAMCGTKSRLGTTSHFTSYSQGFCYCSLCAYCTNV
jgi:hypothetical protein